jgi:signal transduction histidine kinase
MTIRRRLLLSFLVILLLFALNLAIFFWGNQKRQTSVEALRLAVSRQILISGLNQNLNDLQKQVTLISEVTTETPTGGDPVRIAQFDVQLQKIESQIGELKSLSGPEALKNIEAFSDTYRKLSASWRTFYENFGIDQSKAITELAVRAEPLAQEVLQKRLPQLQTDENARVEAASMNFYQVARLTDRIIILIFAISVAVAIAVAVIVSEKLTWGLARLKAGAASIGSGDFGYRIDLVGKDELVGLASAFNEMSSKLRQARDELTLVNQQERQKGEELERAIDQLRKAQDQLVVQQKLASLGSLTAGIAHEIKNPLNFVTNFSEVSVGLADELQALIEEQGEHIDLKERQNIAEILRDLRQNVSKIQEHGKRADGIVRNMLMHSRGQAGDRQMTNLNTLLSEYVKLAYHGMRAQNSNFNVTIVEHFDPSLEPLNVVAHDLSRVFLNIANNACYAAYEKKKRLGDGFAPTVSVSTKNLPSAVEIRIKDNGDGIPENIQSRIFEPFFTTKPAGSGTGLGLSMSYDIIAQQHKGAIRVESEPAQYAEFVIVLPKSQTR